MAALQTEEPGDADKETKGLHSTSCAIHLMQTWQSFFIA